MSLRESKKAVEEKGERYKSSGWAYCEAAGEYSWYVLSFGICSCPSFH
jgi:predicted nucleic acid-binding Zn finger protein